MDPRGIAGLTLQLHTDSTHQPTSGGRGCGYLRGGDTGVVVVVVRATGNTANNRECILIIYIYR